MMAIEGHHEREIEQWQRSRFLAWITALTVTPKDERVTIYKFLPLPGDPSEAEQKAMEEKARMNEYKDLKKMVDEGSEYVKMLQRAALLEQNNLNG